MAGILDLLGLGDNQPSGGILAAGGAPSSATPPSWASGLGMFGSSLQDAGAFLGGHPADATNIDAYQKFMRQQQLRQAYQTAASSSDPAARQQAYGQILANGGDPTALQNNQANAAYPQLMQNMQPTSVAVTPEVGSTNPAAPAQRAAAQQINASPGMQTTPTLQQATALTGVPELAQKIDPMLLQGQIAAATKAAEPYNLEPGQHRFVGNQDIASVPLKPDPNSPFNPDGTPNLQFQAYDKAKQAAGQAPAWANYELAKQKQQDSLIDPGTREVMAQQYLAGDPSVLTGLARGNPANIPLVRAEIVKQANAAGMKGGDIATKMAEFKGLTAGERALGTRTAQVGMASNEFAPMADQAQSAMTDLGPSGFMPLAKLEQAFQQNTNDPKLAKAVAANNAVINTYARLINPNGVPTDSDKQHARDMLSTAQSLPAYNAALNQMRQEGQIAKSAPSQARSEIGTLFSGNASPAPNPQSLPRIGTKIIGGKTYVKQGNQWFEQ